jgi:glucan phosphoethanolaminetransferase (alkaline phosphatase superfamily)
MGFSFFRNKELGLIKLSLITTIIYSLSILPIIYVHFPIADIVDFIKVFLHWMLLSISSYFIIAISLSNRFISIVTIPLFFLISAVGGFFSYQFDMTFNDAILESIFETNQSEVADLISIQLIVYLLSVFIISILIVLNRQNKKGVNLAYFISILLSFFFFSLVNKYKNNTLNQKIPFSYYQAFVDFEFNQQRLNINRIEISEGSFSTSDSLTVIVVIGESQRSDHIGINGYYRNTMPLVTNRGTVFFSKIYSEWTHTNKSLPLILTRADSSDYSKTDTEKSFISIFNKCGFSTSWIGNQIPGWSYSSFVEENNYVFISKPELTVYSNSKKLDTDLLPVVNERLNSNKGKNNLIVIHQIGSHWWYNSHYPDSLSFYKPVLRGKNFNVKYKEEYINSYDNTIRFTDIFIDKVIDEISDRKSILIYLSDHGESMGENGKWLHANEVDEERNPACFIWMSDKYKNKYPNKETAINKNRLEHFRTDFLFHSVLGLSDISSKYYEKELSVLR